MQRQTNEDVGEYVRKQFVHAMRQGERLCLDIDKSVPDWAAYNKEGTFDADMFFNMDEFKKEDNYMKYVRENENHGIGGVNPGFGYTRSPDFCCIIRSGVSEEETLNEQIAKIPNFYSDFHHVVIS